MKGVLVDSCVILDILTEDPMWFDWSARTLGDCSEKYPLFINSIIYSEVSIRFETIEEVEETLSQTYFKKAALPWEAAFLAGKVFAKYRKMGGKHELPLPDFFIGAHALVGNLFLLTRDKKRFSHYFPTLNKISPEN